MGLYDSLLKPVLFQMDPETVHELAFSVIESGLLNSARMDDPKLHQSIFGVDFPNPLGLAAGFDKDGRALKQWHGFGFGFVEVGTVTALPQPGNPKPRLFRLPQDEALINRMGFNNRGAEALAAKVRSGRGQLPLGINLGKNKETSPQDAAANYQAAFRAVQGLADYYVINVSSPNTVGLRDLQDKGPLREIIVALREVDAHAPLFVKLAPDLGDGAIDQAVELAMETSLTGLIATNTTISREGISTDPGQTGGLSGKPLKKRANEVLQRIARAAKGQLTLIGVGGISSADDLVERIASGAHLCQLYTGFIYGGPTIAVQIVRELAEFLNRENVTLADLRGSRL